MLADVVTIIGTQDIVFGEVDRYHRASGVPRRRARGVIAVTRSITVHTSAHASSMPIATLHASMCGREHWALKASTT